ncbi:MAG: hypothetical protein WD066_05845 [Planctomycetaceae bacterium]
MSLGPILPGRLPNSLSGVRLTEALRQANQSLQRLQDQAATGQRYFLPSESPTDAIRTIFLQKTLERQAHFRQSLATDRSMLVASEAALADIGESLSRAKSLLLAGIGDSVTDAERDALAIEAGVLLQQVVAAGNTKFRGRFLFGGSESQRPPFELQGSTVVYRGDTQAIMSFVDAGLLTANNVDGRSAFAALSTPISKDVNPALTLDTRIADLHGGLGVALGKVTVTVDDGTNPVTTRTIDLSAAGTLRDVKTALEDGFSDGPPSITVEIDPDSKHGLRITPSGGTVTVADSSGGRAASDLGIAATAQAIVDGGDLDPRLTLNTSLADLNGGAGIGVAAGNGLRIAIGGNATNVDISAATTVEDLFNTFRLLGLPLDLAINDAGNGLAVSSRVSGASFSIGENGGTNAAGLGIRTFDGDTLLADLNGGQGVPVDQRDASGALLPATLEITRRDGSEISIDLKGLRTVQEALDAINAVDPGVLIASLAAEGNGISLLDDDGASTGPFIVKANAVATALGIAGIEPGGDPAVPLTGADVNPQQPAGVFSIVSALETALRNSDDAALSRLDGMVNAEIARFATLRGEIGGRLRMLDGVENRLLDEDIRLQEALSLHFDADLTDVVTQVAATQTALQATLQIAASNRQLTLFNYL